MAPFYDARSTIDRDFRCTLHRACLCLRGAGSMVQGAGFAIGSGFGVRYMTKTTWTVGAEDHGVRLDKFLAGVDRLGSRSKSADAREKGKVFVNDAEVGPRD